MNIKNKNNLPIYCVIRTERGYLYDNINTINNNERLDILNRSINSEFISLWNNLFSNSFKNIRIDLRSLTIKILENAKFDKIYYTIDDFIDEYNNIKNKNYLVYFIDDDDWVSNDICTIIRKYYNKKYDALIWKHVRLNPFKNTIESPYMTDEKGVFNNISPNPFLQSNHCVIKYPIKSDNLIGTYYKKIGYRLPINHSCINYYLFTNAFSFLFINKSLSFYNSSPVSSVYYCNDYKQSKFPFFVELFKNDGEIFYKNVKNFINSNNIIDKSHSIPSEFKEYVNILKDIFKKYIV